jgi:hypothetical protein
VETDASGYIVDVRPATPLIVRCEEIGIEQLRRRFGLQSPLQPIQTQQDPEDDPGASHGGPEEESPLAFDLDEPLDDRRRDVSEQVIREGASEFSQRPYEYLGQFMLNYSDIDPGGSGSGSHLPVSGPGNE